jgi:hypothetical protein
MKTLIIGLPGKVCDHHQAHIPIELSKVLVNKRKLGWLITAVFCLMNFAVSIGASIFTPGIGFISYSFGVSTVVATLGLSL